MVISINIMLLANFFLPKLGAQFMLCRRKKSQMRELWNIALFNEQNVD